MKFVPSILNLVLFVAGLLCHVLQVNAQAKPNIVFIYADDLGYGDVSAYGSTKLKTPGIDKLAKQGVLFTNAYATSATCTPSRYSLLTGIYAWRQKGTEIAPGDAPLIIDTALQTLPKVLQKAGYTTAAIGKWHLGLGGKNGPNWNGETKPGPAEVGFTYSFIVPATLDRVPTVFMENDRVLRLDPADPIHVDYARPVGNEPTAEDHPELLTMKPSNGHSKTIINGISRIGYMSGGQAARWKDEDMADTLVARAVDFMGRNQNKPFFLYFASGDPHVPRAPHPRFVGKSGMGPRGDAILQLDWTVKALMKALDSLGLGQNTMIIFTSDNGPVIDDGYQDEAVEKLNGHTPWGPFRGGKYSAFEAGTRVPFIVSWPKSIAKGKHSSAAVSQVDFTASLAALTGQKLSSGVAPDSYNILPALLGKSTSGRPFVVEHAGTLAIVKDGWKYIAPGNGPRMAIPENVELGNNPKPQLYNLKTDKGERTNLAKKYPGKVKELAALLEKVKAGKLPRKI